ncbi:MAG: hypothetical protein IPH71_05790 [Proteobacteria bacterium]|nr:hypothetical protein [Pseudomonadota bacterium]
MPSSAKRFPDAASVPAHIPNMLRALGFAPDRADYVARHIVVDPRAARDMRWAPR